MATAQVLPREVRLVPPPTVPQARSYLFKQQSTQGNYSAGSNTPIQINIPRLQRSYLSKDSYLKFRMKVTLDTANQPALFFDQPGAFGVFNRIEIYDYLGSTLLESIDGTNVLTALLMNISVNKDEMSNHYNVTSGISSGTPYPLHDGKAATTVYHEFCIPLFSFLGMLSSKFAPLHNGYTIMLTMETKERFAWTGLLSTDANAALSDTIVKKTTTMEKYTLEISNVYFCAQILELGPVAESMLLSSSQGAPLVVNSKSYRHYTNTVPASSSNVRVDLNLNVASLTNIMFTQRRTKYLTYPTCKNLSMFIRNFLQSWYFQYGSSILPQTQGIQCRPPSNLNTTMKTDTFSKTSFSLVSGGEEAYNELLKSRHSLTSSNFDSLINNTNWNIDDDGFVFGINNTDSNFSELDVGIKKWDTSATPSNQEETGNKTFSSTGSDWSQLNGRTTAKFACGLDLEVVSGKAGDLICGMNTNGMNTSIMLNFDPTLSSSVQDTMVDVWCEFDSFVNISPGIATTVSF